MNLGIAIHTTPIADMLKKVQSMLSFDTQRTTRDPAPLADDSDDDVPLSQVFGAHLDRLALDVPALDVDVPAPNDVGGTARDVVHDGLMDMAPAPSDLRTWDMRHDDVARIKARDCIRRSPVWRARAEAAYGTDKPSKPLRCNMTCAGIDAPSRALLEYGVPIDVVDCIEYDPSCEPVLRMLHPNLRHRLQIRDLTTIAGADLHTADMYMAGFPCPPVSLMGGKGERNDPRFLVFETGLNHLHELSLRHDSQAIGLKAFCLEYVTGALKAKNKGDQTCCAFIQARLIELLPHFVMHLFIENANDHGLPQDRRRIFFVGVHRHVMACLVGDTHLSPPRSVMPMKPAKLSDFLDKCAVMPDLTLRTAKQQANILHYKAKLSELMQKDSTVKCAVCDHSRNESKKWGEFFNVEECGTITCQDSSKWLLGEVEGCVTGTGRPFTMSERAKCHGLVAEPLVSALRGQKTSLNRVLGNTIPVDVIGAVFASIMPAIVAYEQAVFYPPPRCMPHAARPRKRRRLSNISAEAFEEVSAASSSSRGKPSSSDTFQEVATASSGSHENPYLRGFE